MDDKKIVGYVLKVDIKHYFNSINHKILLKIIEEKIKDQKVMWLIETILKNHKTEIQGKGMPLGNLTSQFFANLYLMEFDRFVKEHLNAAYYLRYVDDFIILHISKTVLLNWKKDIDHFLTKNLELELHPEKSRIIPLRSGVTLLGFRVFSNYRLLKKSNARRIWKRLRKFKHKYDNGEMTRKEIMQSLDGWLAYAEFADSYLLRRKVMTRSNELFRVKST